MKTEFSFRSTPTKLEVRCTFGKHVYYFKHVFIKSDRPNEGKPVQKFIPINQSNLIGNLIRITIGSIIHTNRNHGYALLNLMTTC